MRRKKKSKNSSTSRGVRDRSREIKEQIYQRFLDEIIFLEFRPGQFINETRVADELPISRTILREILQRLIVEGLLRLEPGQGIFVQTIDLVALHDLLEVRLQVEAFAARLAAQRASPEIIQRMQDLIIAGEDASKNNNYREVVRRELALHEIIGEASRNSALAGMVPRLMVPFGRLWYMAMSERGRTIGDVWLDWRNILAALQSRSSFDAEKAMTDHVVVTESLISPTLSLHREVGAYNP